MTKFLKGMVILGALALAPTWAMASEAEAAAVIGKLRLMKNGQEMALGRGLFKNPAKLTLIDTATRERLRVKVSDDGAFSWRLGPGQYRLTDIEFMVRGERVSAQSNFVLNVSDDAQATYVGTVTLQTTFEAGHYGLTGAVDGYQINDDCAADCGPMLSSLGMAGDPVTVALLRPNLELVTHGR